MKLSVKIYSLHFLNLSICLLKIRKSKIMVNRKVYLVTDPTFQEAAPLPCTHSSGPVKSIHDLIVPSAFLTLGYWLLDWLLGIFSPPPQHVFLSCCDSGTNLSPTSSSQVSSPQQHPCILSSSSFLI